jgi:hypothetical protein
MIFSARIRNSRIDPIEIAYYLTNVSKLEGSEVEVTLAQKKTSRSIRQNRYYFGVVVYMIKDRLEELGYRKNDVDSSGVPAKLTLEDVHEFLKSMFNRVDVMGPDADILGTTVKSTKELSTKEMIDYISLIIQWAATELDLSIPDPPTENSYGGMADSEARDDVQPSNS